MTRKYKKKLIDEYYLQDAELAGSFENAIDQLLKNDIRITKNRLKNETKFKSAQLDAFYRFHCKEKKARIEMNCTLLDKKIWKYKAEKAGKTVSQLVAESLHQTYIVVPFTDKTRKEMQQVINERVRFNSLLNQAVKWCNTHKSGVEAIQILLELNQLNKAFEQHDLRVMSILAEPLVDHKFRVARVDPLDVQSWR
ncbi:hypothetical protein DZ860_11315 [Vibrio sinensis]|uniref:Uncharacterized protein n=1 Tax=Vibrio sinensis TaxID=2302434 RepID=A0A3A6QFF7_9VIBR|nr:hypothetical protein [Vibrio sinensis]RJX70917.1 hypothetical protein DZ860_11315 [Vibrio sinensis]